MAAGECDRYGHRWFPSADGDRVECYWCLVSPLSSSAEEPCDRFNEAVYYGVEENNNDKEQG
jgi:hypothetical protein